MKKLVTLVLAGVMLILAGCQKETELIPSSKTAKCATITYCGSKTVNLIANQYTNIGTVLVGNDADNLYVTYTATAANWYLTQMHLFVGDYNAIPKNSSGKPVPGQYPYAVTFNNYNCVKTYTFTIPLSNLPQCFTVSAHAAVIKKSGGYVCSSATAWGQGTYFSNQCGWGMYYSYCKESCQPSGEGCAYRAPYWFNGYNSWPNSQITVAGYSYTQSEGFALGNYYNNTAYSEAMFVFFQDASIRLSGNSVGRDATAWKDVAVIESWLSAKGKITTANLPQPPAEVMTAASNIEYWSDVNDCDVSQ